MVVGALIVKHVENLSNDRHAEEKRRALCERNEIEATFGTPDFVIVSPKKNKSSNIPQRECNI